MQDQDDRQLRITELKNRRKLLVILISEYSDRLKYDFLSADKIDRAKEDLKGLQAQLTSIDTAMRELEDESDAKFQSPSE